MDVRLTGRSTVVVLAAALLMVVAGLLCLSGGVGASEGNDDASDLMISRRLLSEPTARPIAIDVCGGRCSAEELASLIPNENDQVGFFFFFFFFDAATMLSLRCFGLPTLPALL